MLADLVLIPVYAVGALVMKLHMPKSYYFMGYVLSCVLCAGVRFSYRYIRFYLHSLKEDGNKAQKMDRIMIIGAGTVGQTLMREIRKADTVHAKVVCAIDDDPEKIGRMLEGIPVVGNRHAIVEMVKKYDVNRIIYAIPSTTGQNRKDIMNLCKETGCRMQTVPSVSQIVNEEVSMTKLREIEISDLLGRKQILVNMDEISDYIKGKVVLVTGGGGSIGSELCRQVAARNPKQLIILDIYENNAYEIQMELKLSLVLYGTAARFSKCLVHIIRILFIMQRLINMFLLWKTVHARQSKTMLLELIKQHLQPLPMEQRSLCLSVPIRR